MTTARSHIAGRWTTDAARIESITRELAEETAIAIGFNGRSHAVLMATPADIEDLAAGFTVTERIAPFGAIAEVRVETLLAGIQVEIMVEGDPDLRERRGTGNSSCGLCGVQTLREALRPITPITSAMTFRRAAIQRAVAELEVEQTLGRRTRATHAAALAAPDGTVVLVREDVGRHNALDKLIGAALRAGHEIGEHFIVVTSRCSYEMVEKAAVARCPLIVAVSAPTALAVTRAAEAGMSLAALARSDGHTVFSGAERIVE